MTPWVFLVVGLFVIGVIQALIEPRMLVTERHKAHVPGLPASWEGATVALLADFQVGLFGDNRSTVGRAVERVLEERPALVLIAGDFIHDTARAIEPVTELLCPLTDAGLPCYAVLGNHDYAMPTEKDTPDLELARRLTSALEEIDVQVLENEAVRLENEAGEALYLVGIGTHTPGHDDPEKALAAVPEGAPRIVMMHHPSSFANVPACAAPFAVAGHTHGGQVRLPLGPGWSLLTWLRDGEVYTDDWVRGHGKVGNRLYVTRGLGCSVAPVRLNCLPELTLFTLTAQKV
ncbi:metallophosphoesterase [Truepera radiovictrix]|uniref:Metallophosphoesterase n=1 Tax=Truepera radiovictrix (strain DSM 17093 / CIP 108686 / LMG 22925 / RQ-24) TaxID=649638 RepID=D7CSB6_TRURR|nr:metallophosphoesterase [Truepera radiovictrix]ADI13648.1 metallophosphoesterase [Truepera radiovictrix DSM 17093]WMT57791.1 metallophosphoesterase [Truepera radiovictrix]